MKNSIFSYKNYLLFMVAAGFALLACSIIMNFVQSVPLFLHPDFPPNEWPEWASPWTRMDPHPYFTQWDAVYSGFAILGLLLVLAGAFSARRRVFWLSLAAAGVLLMASFTGQYLDLRKYWDINNYLFHNSEGDFYTGLQPYIWSLILGVACIISGLLLRRMKPAVPMKV